MKHGDEDRMSRRSYFKALFALAGGVVGSGFLSACSEHRQESATQKTQPVKKAAPNTQSSGSNAPVAKKTSLSCTDVSGLTKKQLHTRKQSNYVEDSPMAMADMDCSTCKHFVAPQNQNTCGTCHSVPGPINPKGFCSLWEQA